MRFAQIIELVFFNESLTTSINYMFKHMVYTEYVFMLNLKFKKKLCIPSRDALKDMVKHNLTPDLVESIIIDGDDYKNKMMRKNEVGRSKKKGKFEIFVKLVQSYSYSLDENVWVIKHIGKRRMKR